MDQIKLNEKHGFEKEPNGLDACISIKHITKVINLLKFYLRHAKIKYIIF
jgi:hypothetical protein